ncbi:hypothetical protein AAU61_04240 [Desulfocarbo indianensis]|nr:hypothetical protein AAU61_04240 [Desulfocarbo indianensis]
MNNRAKTLLVAAGIICLALAMLHLEIIYLGAPAYRYFGAGEEMAAQAQAGSWTPPLLTAGIALLLAGFAGYAFSGAGLLRPWPWARPALWAIAGVFTLRGLAVFVQLAAWAWGGRDFALRELAFSLTALALGLLFLAGARGFTAGSAAKAA